MLYLGRSFHRKESRSLYVRAGVPRLPRNDMGYLALTDGRGTWYSPCSKVSLVAGERAQTEENQAERWPARRSNGGVECSD